MITINYKALREELKKFDRLEKRQNLNIEYLKNIVLSYLESDVKEPLIPVVTQVLQLSPEETDRYFGLKRWVHETKVFLIPPISGCGSPVE